MVLTKRQIAKQEEFDKEVRDMISVDEYDDLFERGCLNEKIDPRFVYIEFDKTLIPEHSMIDIRRRFYWPNGVKWYMDRVNYAVGFPEPSIKTINKSLDRLEKKGIIWFLPNFRNQRLFQLCFEDWEKTENHIIPTKFKIPRIKEHWISENYYSKYLNIVS